MRDVCREDWQIGEENTKRAGETLKIIYRSDEGGVTKTFTGHKDIRESLFSFFSIKFESNMVS